MLPFRVPVAGDAQAVERQLRGACFDAVWKLAGLPDPGWALLHCFNFWEEIRTLPLVELLREWSP
jgi:hypothetical protein